MSCYCKCPVTLPRSTGVDLPCVIVVFPDHTHFLLFACADALHPSQHFFSHVGTFSRDKPVISRGLSVLLIRKQPH